MSRPITPSGGGSSSRLISNRSRIEKRLFQATRELNRVIDMCVKGIVDPEAMRERIKSLEADKKRFAADLASAEQPPEMVALHPAAIARYRAQLDDLHGALNSGDQEPVRAMRELVAAIVVSPSAPSEPLKIEIRGHLAALMKQDVFPQARVEGEVVAEARYVVPPDRIRRCLQSI